MSRWEDDLLDDFLAEVGDAEDVGALVDALSAPPADPSSDLRQRLLEGATLQGRFDRFGGPVARLLDVDEAEARRLLDGIGDESRWVAGPLPAVSLYDLQGGPAVANAITGFVRMPAGAVFPEHEHLGHESVLVVQGSFEDGVSGEVYRAGDLATMPPHSAHDFRVRPGPDLVYLVVLYDGVKIGEMTLGPDDPGM